MKKTLILGGSGFLGQHLEYRLKADGHFIVSAGPSYEPHTSAMGGNAGGYVGAYIEGGTQIPDTPDNLMVGIIGDFFTGVPEPIGGLLAVNFPLGQPWIRAR